MKTLNQILLFGLFITCISCNKNDDQIIQNKDYFPTKIVVDVHATTPFQEVLTIQYDNQNRITNINLVDGANTLTNIVSYNSENLISKIILSKVSTTTSNTITFNFNYTGELLSQVILSNATTAITYNYSYNSTTNTYTNTSVTTGSEYFKFDNNGNLSECMFAGGGAGYSFNYFTNNKIYRGIKHSLPLIIANSYMGLEAFLNCYLFFANNEITKIETTGGSIITSATTDENHNVTKLDYIESGIIYSTSNVEYELRNVE